MVSIILHSNHKQIYSLCLFQVRLGYVKDRRALLGIGATRLKPPTGARNKFKIRRKKCGGGGRVGFSGLEIGLSQKT